MSFNKKQAFREDGNTTLGGKWPGNAFRLDGNEVFFAGRQAGGGERSVQDIDKRFVESKAQLLAEGRMRTALGLVKERGFC